MSRFRRFWPRHSDIIFRRKVLSLLYRSMRLMESIIFIFLKNKLWVRYLHVYPQLRLVTSLGKTLVHIHTVRRYSVYLRLDVCLKKK